MAVIGSNLSELITPQLILQLEALKAHLKIKSFKQIQANDLS